MPEVGKIMVRFRKDENPREFKLYYSQKEKFYIKNVPADFVRLTEFVSSHHSTEDGIRNHLNECIKIFQEKLKTERDVILYRISASAYLTMNEIDENHYSGQKRGVSKRISDLGGSSPKCCFGIEYKKCKEIDEGGKKYYPYKQSGTLGFEMRVEKSWSVIEWTPEREAFFEGLYKSMENLVEKISVFFSDDDEKVLTLIDSAGGSIKLIQA